MNETAARRINTDLLRPLLHTSWRFWALVVFLGAIVLTGLGAWLYQMYFGFGVSGVRWPIFWAFYVTNFVFWFWISHAGRSTLSFFHRYMALVNRLFAGY